MTLCHRCINMTESKYEIVLTYERDCGECDLCGERILGRKIV